MVTVQVSADNWLKFRQKSDGVYIYVPLIALSLFTNERLFIGLLLMFWLVVMLL